MHMARLWDASRKSGYSLSTLTEEVVGRRKVPWHMHMHGMCMVCAWYMHGVHVINLSFGARCSARSAQPCIVRSAQPCMAH